MVLSLFLYLAFFLRLIFIIEYLIENEWDITDIEIT